MKPRRETMKVRLPGDFEKTLKALLQSPAPPKRITRKRKVAKKKR